MSDLQSWPEDWPLYKQGCFGSWDDCCDMLVGPCKCGAGHAPGEFEYKDGVLTRYGQPVPTRSRQPLKPAKVKAEVDLHRDEDGIVWLAVTSGGKSGMMRVPTEGQRIVNQAFRGWADEQLARNGY